jgi:hypothetical protein
MNCVPQDPGGGGPHHPAGGAEPSGQRDLPPAHLLRQAEGHPGHLAVGQPDEAAGAAEPRHGPLHRGEGPHKLPAPATGMSSTVYIADKSYKLT